MTKIFKHLAKHWAACLVIIALLLVQAYGDLTLPDYTSKIAVSYTHLDVYKRQGQHARKGVRRTHSTSRPRTGRSRSACLSTRCFHRYRPVSYTHLDV